MITPAYRQTILEMVDKGVSIREITRILKVGRNTVRSVIKKGADPLPIRESSYTQHLPVIKDLYRECGGNVVRVFLKGHGPVVARAHIGKPGHPLVGLRILTVGLEHLGIFVDHL